MGQVRACPCNGFTVNVAANEGKAGEHGQIASDPTASAPKVENVQWMDGGCAEQLQGGCQLSCDESTDAQEAFVTRATVDPCAKMGGRERKCVTCREPCGQPCPGVARESRAGFLVAKDKGVMQP